MKLYTARYLNRALASRQWVTVRITLGAPKMPLPYPIEYEVPDLAPPKYLFHVDDRSVFEPKYHKHLDRVGLDVVTAKLRAIAANEGGKPLALLCFEKVAENTGGDPMIDWCHRRCFASWWQLKTGTYVEEIPEVGRPEPEDLQQKLF